MMPIFRRIPDFYSCIPDTQARIPDSTSKNFQDIQGYSLTRGDMLLIQGGVAVCLKSLQIRQYTILHVKHFLLPLEGKSRIKTKTF